MVTTPDKMERPHWDEKFGAILRQVLPEIPSDAPIDPDQELRALGLNSLRMVELLLVLESEYGATLFDAELDYRVFATSRSLRAFVAERINLDEIG